MAERAQQPQLRPFHDHRRAIPPEYRFDQAAAIEFLAEPIRPLRKHRHTKPDRQAMQHEICLFIEKHGAPGVAVRAEGRFHQLARQKDDVPDRALAPGNLQRAAVNGGLLPQAPNELLTSHCDLKPESFERRGNRGADLLVPTEGGDEMKLRRSVRLGRPLSNKPMQMD
jgi:hypothetical protein